MTTPEPPDFTDLAALNLFDAHIHSGLGYCSAGNDVAAAIRRSRSLGVLRMGIVEHADQLYFPREGFWERRDTNDRAVIRAQVAAGHGRIQAFRAFVGPMRSEAVLAGLEVEPAADRGDPADSGLALLDGDDEGFDYVLGGIHWLPGIADPKTAPRQELVAAFMTRTERLVRGGIDVLAHPFRFLQSAGVREMGELYRPVAEMLAGCGVAAEINFHNVAPDPAFYAVCLDLGVRLATGSDAHKPDEVDLRPCAALLRRLGVQEARLPEILWLPASLST